jgi:hypothetical protein
MNLFMILHVDIDVHLDTAAIDVFTSIQKSWGTSISGKKMYII